MREEEEGGNLREGTEREETSRGSWELRGGKVDGTTRESGGAHGEKQGEQESKGGGG